MLKPFYKIILATALLFPVIANAEQIKNIDAIDFLTEYEDLQGQMVQLNDCVAYGVVPDFFICSLPKKTESSATISINLTKTPKKQLSYGMKKCGSIMGTEEEICSATIKGIANKTESGEPNIDAVEVIWNAEH